MNNSFVLLFNLLSEYDIIFFILVNQDLLKTRTKTSTKLRKEKQIQSLLIILKLMKKAINIDLVIPLINFISLVKSAVIQPKKRRLGLKRINTNLQILLEEPAQNDDVKQNNKVTNEGIFYAHGVEYTYDKRSLWLLNHNWRVRKIIVWIITWT